MLAPTAEATVGGEKAFAFPRRTCHTNPFVTNRWSPLVSDSPLRACLSNGRITSVPFAAGKKRPGVRFWVEPYRAEGNYERSTKDSTGFAIL